jgi:hypothetical protein
LEAGKEDEVRKEEEVEDEVRKEVEVEDEVRKEEEVEDEVRKEEEVEDEVMMVVKEVINSMTLGPLLCSQKACLKT